MTLCFESSVLIKLQLSPPVTFGGVPLRYIQFRPPFLFFRRRINKKKIHGLVGHFNALSTVASLLSIAIQHSLNAKGGQEHYGFAQLPHATATPLSDIVHPHIALLHLHGGFGFRLTQYFSYHSSPAPAIMPSPVILVARPSPPLPRRRAPF